MKTVSVLGKTYQIIETTQDASYGCSGASNATKLVISVNRDLPIGQYDDTLLHEVIHAIDRELHLDFTEETVARLAVGLYSAGCRVLVNETKPGKARTRSAKGAKE